MSDTAPPDGDIQSHDPPNSYDPDQYKSGDETLSIEQRMLLAGIEPVLDEPQFVRRVTAGVATRQQSPLNRGMVYATVANALLAIDDLSQMSVATYLDLVDVITDSVLEGLS